LAYINLQGFCRVDFVGGTTDLWPLYCHLGSTRVINMAIPVKVKIDLSFEKSAEFVLNITSKEMNSKSMHKSLDSLKADLTRSTKENSLRWIHRMCFYSFQKAGVTNGAWNLSIQSDAPPGSGLGGSSVLGAAIAKAIFDICKTPNVDAWAIHNFIVNLEAAEIEKPAGEQDAIPALFGGLLSFSLSADSKKVEHYDLNLGQELGSRSALIHTGKPHHS
jgi:galactokinase/mevalonate kinase-like predicted kinase